MLSTFLSAVGIPIISDFIKSAAPSISRKWFGESVDDQVKLADVEIRRLEAVAKLDNQGGTSSKWVVDLRGAFRYVASGVLVVGGLVLVGIGINSNMPESVVLGTDLALAPSGFILGERMVLSYNKGKK